MEVQGVSVVEFIYWIISAYDRPELVFGSGAGKYSPKTHFWCATPGAI